MVVWAKIQKEVKEGQVFGPFTAPPVPNFRVFLLGVILKKEAAEFCLIYHLSYPEGISVNDQIPQELCSI